MAKPKVNGRTIDYTFVACPHDIHPGVDPEWVEGFVGGWNAKSDNLPRLKNPWHPVLQVMQRAAWFVGYQARKEYRHVRATK